MQNILLAYLFCEWFFEMNNFLISLDYLVLFFQKTSRQNTVKAKKQTFSFIRFLKVIFKFEMTSFRYFHEDIFIPKCITILCTVIHIWGVEGARLKYPAFFRKKSLTCQSILCHFMPIRCIMHVINFVIT